MVVDIVGHLPQKLKAGTPEQKYDIVEAIIAQAYPLMVNHFGTS